jgi:membrane associated rhomboid family serine protease
MAAVSRSMGFRFPTPSRTLRRLLWVLPAAYTVQLVVYLAMGFRDDVLWAHLQQPLRLAPGDVFGGQVWQVATWWAVYPVQAFLQVLMDVLVLYLFGSAVEEARGRRMLLRALATGILVGAGAHLLAGVVLQGVWPAAWAAPLMGARTALMALVGLWGWIYRNAPMFGGPIRGWHLLALFVGLDVLGALTIDGRTVAASLAAVAAGMMLGGAHRTLRNRVVLAWQRRKLKVLQGGRPKPPPGGWRN